MSSGLNENCSLRLRNGRVVTPDALIEGMEVLIKGGRIESLIEQSGRANASVAGALDLTGLTLFPGFIDVHIHGAVGVDTMDATTADLHRVARFLAQEGVTAWLPTFVPAPDEDYRRAALAVEQLMAEQDARRPPAARALGLHYEGPFINRAQCGALRPPYFRTYKEPSDVGSLPVVGEPPAIRMITVAPEIEGGIELVCELRKQDWIVSIGHTRAGLESLEGARAAGARHMTHFFNAMSPLHHRAPGPVGWGLLSDDVTCDIIADGEHVAPLMLELALRCKTAKRLMLISDAVAPAGQDDGEFRIWGEMITVENGRTRNERGSIAGSVITMRDAVKRMLALGVAPADAARMASTNPARLLGVEASCGTIETGKRADLVALNDQGEVRLTVIGGRVAFAHMKAV
ncbi:MAG: N-acetylglucosamine-6-phosphate deacetylase [Pyrinomonadaceae bacterium]